MKALVERQGPTPSQQTMAKMSLPYHGGSLLSTGWQANRIAQVRHFLGWVNVAVTAKAKIVSHQEPTLSVVRPAVPDRSSKDGFRYRGADRLARLKSLTAIKPHEDLEPLDEKHALFQLFANPNPEDTPADVWYETSVFLELTGNAYWWLPKNGWGLPAEIWVLPSHWIFPISDGPTPGINAYEARPFLGGVGTFRFPSDEILHFRHRSPLSRVDGFSPLTAGATWVDQSKSIDVARFASFKNGAYPGVAVELPPDMDNPSQEDIDKIEQRFVNKFSGENRYGRPIIMRSGMKTTPLTISPREMDFNASFDQVRDSVLALFHVSKTAAGITDEVNFASALVAKAIMYENGINPLLTLIDQTATKKLASRYDRRIRIWHQDMTPKDPAQVLAENTAYLDRGVISINEVREDLGKEPYQHGGDDPCLPAGVAPVPFKSGDSIDWDGIIESAQAAQGQQPGQQQPGAGGTGGQLGGLIGGAGDTEQPGTQLPAKPAPQQPSERKPRTVLPGALQSRLNASLTNGHAKAETNGRALTTVPPVAIESITPVTTATVQPVVHVHLTMPGWPEQKAPVTYVTVEQPDPSPVNVTVNTPEQPAPVVNVAAPAVTVSPPNVTVAASPAPVVNVAPPAVTVTVPPAPPTTKTIRRDDHGDIVEITEKVARVK